MTAKRHFQLSERERRELKQAFRQSKHGPFRTRLQAVQLYGSGYPVEEIMEITGYPRRTVLRWSARYRRGGIAALEDRRKGGNRALMSEVQLEALCRRLHQYRPLDVLGPGDVATPTGEYWTVPDLRRALKQWYGIVYQRPHSYRVLFYRCGFSYQRDCRFFRSQSESRMAAFEEQLQES